MFPHHSSRLLKFHQLKLGFLIYKEKFRFSSFPSPNKDNKLAQDVFNWAKVFFVKATFGLIGLFATGLFGNAAYLEYERARRKNLFNSTIENGSFPIVDETQLVSRPEVEKILVNVLSPPRKCLYVLITGEHGTGKTTAIQLACNKVKKGIIYVDVPIKSSQFPQMLANALNFDSSPLMGLQSFITKKILKQDLENLQPQQNMLIDEIERTLEKAAIEYSKKHKKPLVLVIDNINILANKDPDTLEILQMNAKRWADEGIIRVVFVASEGSAPKFLQKNSAWSRAAKPTIEVGDFNEAQSIEFLKKRGVDDNIAKNVYSLVGGRIQLLCMYQSHMSFEEMKRIVFTEVNRNFRSAGILDQTNPLHKPGMLLMNTILSSKDGVIQSSTLQELIPSQEIQDKLLQAQVFSYHPSSDTITFQSRATENYAKILKAKKKFWFF